MEDNITNITDTDVQSIINGDVDDSTNNEYESSDMELQDDGSVSDKNTRGRFDKDIEDLDIIDEYKDEQYLRFKGAEWFDSFKYKNLTIIGAGGISSWAAIILSRLRFNYMEVYDSGKVELKNMSGQMFTRGDIGDYKSDAVVNNVRLFNWDTISCCSMKYNFDALSQYRKYDIVVSGVDSMSSRKDIFDKIKGNDIFYIDGRLSADSLQILALDMNDNNLVERYERSFLFSDKEADETICSFKQTTYMAAMIGSLICNIIVNKVNNLTNMIEYPVPFLTEYDSMTMRLKTSM